MESKNLKEKALENDGWIKKEGQSNNWKGEYINDEIVGIYKGFTVEETNWGEKNKYIIETQEGVKYVYGTVVLDDLFRGLKEGVEIKIIYIDEKPNSPPKKPTKIYEMYTRMPKELRDDPEARTTIDIIRHELIGQGIRDPRPEEIIKFAERTTDEYDPDAITRIKRELARQMKKEGNSDD